MELYKSVDVRIRERFGTADGVSEYIRRLEQLPQSAKAGSRLACIRQDHRMLKHLRWARNMLAHEASYSDEILKDGDMEWLDVFSRELRQSRDILSTFDGKTNRNKKKSAKHTLADRIREVFFG